MSMQRQREMQMMITARNLAGQAFKQAKSQASALSKRVQAENNAMAASYQKAMAANAAATQQMIDGAKKQSATFKKVGGDADLYHDRFTKSFYSIERTTVGGFQRMMVAQLAWSLGFMALFAPLALFTSRLREVVNITNEFARAVRTITSETENLTQATNRAFKVLNQELVRTGQNAKFISEVMYRLGSAGLSAEEALAALGSTLDVLIGTEADMTATTMGVAGAYNVLADTIYRLEDGTVGFVTQMQAQERQLQDNVTLTEKFTLINDVLARTFRDHMVGMNELIDGLKFSIATSTIAGIRFTELVGIIATLNDRMIKAGHAGRGFQAMLSQLVRKSREFAHIYEIEVDPDKPLEIMKVFEQMYEKIGDGTLSLHMLGEAFRLTGLRGARVITTLMQHFEELRDNIEKLDEQVSGSAKYMADIMLDRPVAAFQRLNQAFIQMLRISFGPIIDGVVSIVKAFNLLFKALFDVYNLLPRTLQRLLEIGTSIVVISALVKTLLLLTLQFSMVATVVNTFHKIYVRLITTLLAGNIASQALSATITSMARAFEYLGRIVKTASVIIFASLVGVGNAFVNFGVTVATTMTAAAGAIKISFHSALLALVAVMNVVIGGIVWLLKEIVSLGRAVKTLTLKIAIQNAALAIYAATFKKVGVAIAALAKKIGVAVAAFIGLNAAFIATGSTAAAVISVVVALGAVIVGMAFIFSRFANQIKAADQDVIAFYNTIKDVETVSPEFKEGQLSKAIDSQIRLLKMLGYELDYNVKRFEAFRGQTLANQDAINRNIGSMERHIKSLRELQDGLKDSETGLIKNQREYDRTGRAINKYAAQIEDARKVIEGYGIEEGKTLQDVTSGWRVLGEVVAQVGDRIVMVWKDIVAWTHRAWMEIKAITAWTGDQFYKGLVVINNIIEKITGTDYLAVIEVKIDERSEKKAKDHLLQTIGEFAYILQSYPLLFGIDYGPGARALEDIKNGMTAMEAIANNIGDSVLEINYQLGDQYATNDLILDQYKEIRDELLQQLAVTSMSSTKTEELLELLRALDSANQNITGQYQKQLLLQKEITSEIQDISVAVDLGGLMQAFDNLTQGGIANFSVLEQTAQRFYDSWEAKDRQTTVNILQNWVQMFNNLTKQLVEQQDVPIRVFKELWKTFGKEASTAVKEIITSIIELSKQITESERRIRDLKIELTALGALRLEGIMKIRDIFNLGIHGAIRMRDEFKSNQQEISNLDKDIVDLRKELEGLGRSDWIRRAFDKEHAAEYHRIQGLITEKQKELNAVKARQVVTETQLNNLISTGISLMEDTSKQYAKIQRELQSAITAEQEYIRTVALGSEEYGASLDKQKSHLDRYVAAIEKAAAHEAQIIDVKIQAGLMTEKEAYNIRVKLADEYTRRYEQAMGRVGDVTLQQIEHEKTQQEELRKHREMQIQLLNTIRETVQVMVAMMAEFMQMFAQDEAASKYFGNIGDQAKAQLQKMNEGISTALAESDRLVKDSTTSMASSFIIYRDKATGAITAVNNGFRGLQNTIKATYQETDKYGNVIEAANAFESLGHQGGFAAQQFEQFTNTLAKTQDIDNTAKEIDKVAQECDKVRNSLSQLSEELFKTEGRLSKFAERFLKIMFGVSQGIGGLITGAITRIREYLFQVDEQKASLTIDDQQVNAAIKTTDELIQQLKELNNTRATINIDYNVPRSPGLYYGGITSTPLARVSAGEGFFSPSFTKQNLSTLKALNAGKTVSNLNSIPPYGIFKGASGVDKISTALPANSFVMSKRGMAALRTSVMQSSPKQGYLMGGLVQAGTDGFDTPALGASPEPVPETAMFELTLNIGKEQKTYPVYGQKSHVEEIRRELERERLTKL